MEASVHLLRSLRADLHTNLHAKHFKQWLQEAYPNENSNTSLRTERWMCLVDIVQHVWSMGEIPQDLGWAVLVLIPKWTT